VTGSSAGAAAAGPPAAAPAGRRAGPGACQCTAAASGWDSPADRDRRRDRDRASDTLTQPGPPTPPGAAGRQRLGGPGPAAQWVSSPRVIQAGGPPAARDRAVASWISEQQAVTSPRAYGPGPGGGSVAPLARRARPQGTVTGSAAAGRTCHGVKSSFLEHVT